MKAGVHRLAAAAWRRLFPPSVAAVVIMGDRVVWLAAHLTDLAGPFRRIELVAPDGSRIPVPEASLLFSHDREGAGDASPARREFAASLDAACPGRVTGRWRLEIERADAPAVSRHAATVDQDPARWRRLILAAMARGSDTLPSTHRQMESISLPNGSGERSAGSTPGAMRQYGRREGPRDITVAVVLGCRTEWLERQLAQFAGDPDMARVDLVYVVSGSAISRIDAAAGHLADLYQTPFRVALVDEPVLPAAAAAAALSSPVGRLLVVLEAAVTPARAGWVSRMAAFHDANPRAGAVGPRLLRWDGTIDQAGMVFEPIPAARSESFWQLRKMSHGERPGAAANSTWREVPAVSGSCLMVAADRYREIGGLSSEYLTVDYAYADLCMRLSLRGFTHWCLDDVETLDLTGPPVRHRWSAAAERCDRWQCSRSWGERLGQPAGFHSDAARAGAW